MRHYTDVARLHARKHLEGRLVAKAASGLPFLLQEGMEVRFVPPAIDAPRKATVEKVCSYAGNSSEAIVSFSGVDNAETAEALVGCHCLLPSEEVASIEPPYGLLAADKMEGWRFHDLTTGFEGRVFSAETVGAQILLTVFLDGEDPDDGGHLVPLAEELVEEKDDAGHVISMRCPVGIFDL